MPAISLRELLNFSHHAAIADSDDSVSRVSIRILRISIFFCDSSKRRLNDFVTVKCYVMCTSYIANANDARNLQTNRESLETRKVGFRKPFLKLISHSGHLVLRSSRRNRTCTYVTWNAGIIIDVYYFWWSALSRHISDRKLANNRRWS